LIEFLSVTPSKNVKAMLSVPDPRVRLNALKNVSPPAVKSLSSDVMALSFTDAFEPQIVHLESLVS